jgi:uncharacterized protein YbjT (DUF2867 family)
MSALTLLTSANGRTGRAVLKALSAAGKPVRAFIRNASQADDLRKLGATEVVVGDLTDAKSLDAAARGCGALVHIGPPMHPEEVAITTGALEAAERNGLQHFVYYSVMHPLRRDVRHHRLKLDCEERIVSSHLNWTILQPSRYMQHLAPIWQQVKDQGIHRMPFNTAVRFSVVDLEDLARAVAVVVSEPRYFFGFFELAGPEALSQDDMAAIVSRVLGRPVRAEAIPLEQMARDAEAKGLSADRVEQMRVMNAHYDRHGFVGNPQVLSMLLGRVPTTFENYVRRLAGS